MPIDYSSLQPNGSRIVQFQMRTMAEAPAYTAELELDDGLSLTHISASGLGRRHYQMKEAAN